MTQLEKVLRAVLDGHQTAAAVAQALGEETGQMASCLSVLSKRHAIRVVGRVQRFPGSPNYSNCWGPGPRVAECLIAFAKIDRKKLDWLELATKPDPVHESPEAIEARYQAAMRAIRARRLETAIDERTVLIRSSLRANGVMFAR